MEVLKSIMTGCGNGKSCAPNLNPSKAFDRVEWNLVIAILFACVFSDKWCNLIKDYISTSVLLDGAPYGVLKPNCGVQQGDEPLSPYIFIIMAETFTRLIRKAESENAIKGVQVARENVQGDHFLSHT